MITLKLYGTLKKLCGKEHKISGPKHIKEIFSYIIVNFPSSNKLLHKLSEYKIAILLNNKSVGIEDLKACPVIFNGDILQLVPITNGEGKWATTIVGIIIMIIGALMVWFSWGSYGWNLIYYGAIMAAGGFISAMLTKEITPANYDNQLKDAALKKSYGWGGSALNLTKSGNPVPLGYGTMRVGSQVISGGLRAENI